MNNLMYKEGLNEKQLYMVETQLEEKKKKTHVTWLWYLFLGSTGAHRFYLGDKGYAWLMLGNFVLLTLVTFGIAPIVWLIVELFLLNKRIKTKNEEIERNIIRDVKMITQK